MKKSDYRLFFYIGDKPVNINIKDEDLNPSHPCNEIKNKILNKYNQKNMYNKAKQKYDFFLKRNKNIVLLNKKSTSGKITSKDYLENRENLEKESKKDDLSLLPFVPNKKENFKNIDELKKLQRNTVTMRRIEYSMKVKNETNKKRFKNNIKKIIIIQKWVRGFLLRNLLCNLSYFEVFTNEFLDHIRKFVFLRHNNNMKNAIKYCENKILSQEEKNYKKENQNNNEEQKNNVNKNSNGFSLNKNEAMSFGDNLNINKNSLDVIKENSNERYIDEDSILEYNNRNKNRIKNDINSNNILFLSSKDFSERNLINSNNNLIISDSNSNLINSNNNININNNANNNPFILNESSIIYEDANKKIEENNIIKKDNKNDTLNSNKEDILSTLKNEEVRDIFNAKHNNNLVKPSSSLINNIINNENDYNNKELFIKRPKLNRKFLEEINSISTPIKKENSIKIDENKNIFKKIEYNLINNAKEEKINESNNIINENKSIKINEEKTIKDKPKINNFIKDDIEKEMNICENDKNKFYRKINYINSIKLNQFGSISNPSNTTKENTSTLDSNTLNINRKLILDENISLTNNNRTVFDDNLIIIKPIIKPMMITKIRFSYKKEEFLIIKYSNSEKKSLPKAFDINYYYSQEKIEDNNINNNNKVIDKNIINNINIDNNNINSERNINNDIDKSISNDININVLNVVNNNVDELNNSIKNIVKEGIPLENNQNKLNPFGKSIRALLDLDKPLNNNLSDNNETEINIIKKEEKEEEKVEKEEKEELNLENNVIDNKENPIDVLNQMSIEEIKEVKEEYEDEKESELNFTQKKLYNSNDIIENSKEIDNILDSNKSLIRRSLAKNQKNNEFIICSQNISFNIVSTLKEKKTFNNNHIFIILLLVKQIKISVKPYIYNLLKKFWIEKLKE